MIETPPMFTPAEPLYVIRLPFPRPPLSSNDRLSRHEHAAATRRIRADTHILARHKLGPGKRPMLPGPVAVRLVVEVNDNRKRDAHNYDPTLKAVQDGLVDVGLLSADDTTVVRRSWVDIERGESRGVRVEVLPL